MPKKTLPSQPPAQGENSALLVIDVQRGLFAKSTPIYGEERLIANLELLIERARLAGVTVVYVQHEGAGLAKGAESWGLHPCLRPLEGELRVEKRHGDAFEDTPLHALLQRRGVGRVVVCGLVTHGCVRATALGALARGYRVTLAGDGHSSFAKDAGKKIEEVNAALRIANIEVREAAELTTDWGGK